MKIIERIREAVDRFAERHLDGHVTIGPLTLYGANAMRWMATLRVEALGVTLSFRPPWFPGKGPGDEWAGWCFYASPNATPWAAVLGCGPGISLADRRKIEAWLDAASSSAGLDAADIAARNRRRPAGLTSTYLGSA